MKLPRLQPITGITLALIPLAYIVVIAVLFFPGFDSQIKGVVVGAIMGAACLGAVSGHWLNDVAKRPPPDGQQVTATGGTVSVTASSDADDRPVIPQPPGMSGK